MTEIISVLIGAVVTWFATRYSDAIRERRSDRQQMIGYNNALNVLMSTISSNLTYMVGIADEANAIQQEISLHGYTRKRVTGLLRVEQVSNIASQLTGFNHSNAVIREALGALQKIEVIDAQLQALKLEHNSPSADFKNPRGVFSCLLSRVIQLAERNGTTFSDIEQHLLNLEKYRTILEGKIRSFYADHSIWSYVVKKD